MKLLYFLGLLALAASAIPVEEGREHGKNGWYIPQQNGSFVWMDLDEGETESEMEDRGLINSTVTFYLYTKENPSNGQKISTTTKSVETSNFNSKNPTRFIIHGWTQSYTATMNEEIRDAWFSRGGFNIIAVDWSRARSLFYRLAAWAVPTVGEKVAAMVDFLVENYKMSLDTLHVIGHSLGAHVAGYAGKNVKSGQIHCIVGLDPASPAFKYDEPNKRLASSDAWYVESIHTNGGVYGFLEPLGKGAFYPNGGQSQPECLTNSCDHDRSTTYYAEAVLQNDFPSIVCKDYVQAVNKSCGASPSPVHMGAVSDADMVAGVFYVAI